MISTTALFIICCVSVFLAWNQHYEDGIFGRLALVIIALGSFIGLLQEANGDGYNFSPVAVTIFTGIAIFMVRHTYRFLRWRKHGDGDWRK